MDRPHLKTWIILIAAWAFWLFLMFSVGSFHATDWPSHTVYPYPPTQNLCGEVGAAVAYACQFVMGQGIYPILLFVAACLILFMAKGRVGDLWMRAVGILLVSIAFSTGIHHLHPASANGLPEGSGGLIGIASSAFLERHVAPTGTRLILLATFIVGLLLAADDLLLATPGAARAMSDKVLGVADRIPTPGGSSLLDKARAWWTRTYHVHPHVPALAGGAAAAAMARAAETATTATADIPKWKLFWRKPKAAGDEADDISYTNDEPVATDVHASLSEDHGPAEGIEIPPAPLTPAPIAVIDAPTVVKPVRINGVLEGGTLEPSAASQTVTTSASRSQNLFEDAPTIREEEIATETASDDGMPEADDGSDDENADSEPKAYILPHWDFLAEPEIGFGDKQVNIAREKAKILEKTLRQFGVDASVINIETGPVITLFEVHVADGVKVSQVRNLQDDIARSLKAMTVRIEAPIPGKDTVGIEVPNEYKEKVRFKELMTCAPDAADRMAIPLYLGKDASGEPLVVDLAAMPHGLIAGTTGSGKSVCINSIILSILYKQAPDMVKLILVDPKMVEMADYENIPHLMCPIINDPLKAASVLEWACQKMDERYQFLAEIKLRHLTAYNAMTRQAQLDAFGAKTDEEAARIPPKMPYIVIIIDELADLMMTSGKETEAFIVRIAQKARAVGIHLILATQRPSANVVTGLIKSNLPTRIAFRVASGMDSRIVLDSQGAEKLMGKGDMLFLGGGMNKPIRCQGTFLGDDEIKNSVTLVKETAKASYSPELMQLPMPGGDGKADFEKDELWEDAVKIVLKAGRGSVSLLQRQLGIGYGRADILINRMVMTGLLSNNATAGARQPTMSLAEWEQARRQQAADEGTGMTV